MGLQEDLAKLKEKFIEYDVFGDLDELKETYFNFIDKLTEDTIKDLSKIKEWFFADDLLYSDEYEIEQTQIFYMIDCIIENYQA